MRQFCLALSVVGMLLGGFQPTIAKSQPRERTAPHVLSASDIEVVKRDVADRLKDPASAMFGDIAASISVRGVITVCGTVNARNSYGGYTGQKPFLGVLATNTSGRRVFALSGLASTDTEVYATLMVCRDSGID